ncbi:hypothetical protein RFI_08995 [Reticulomyxa filosa]|uniref:Uncharacterized protein n=1 Tax=Reticulomyxa filosa TaxID=46433 RepID=X6NPC2_RETFI|nr:hypothetical protein RFI_08995 [Reticulomyxa filosa]|eukprot:ETO28135.1 hypothetical protein RFI_08995 [Reticulomyxa filosa]
MLFFLIGCCHQLCATEVARVSGYSRSEEAPFVHGPSETLSAVRMQQIVTTQKKVFTEEQTSDEKERSKEKNKEWDRNSKKKIYEEKKRKIESKTKNERTMKEVMDLWECGVNLQDVTCLKECYAESAQSRQLNNETVQSRAQILQLFSNMFKHGDDNLNVEIKTIATSGSSTTSDSDRNGTLSMSLEWMNGGELLRGCGIIHIQDGLIHNEEFYFDQDIHWFQTLGVIKFNSQQHAPVTFQPKLAKLDFSLNLDSKSEESSSSRPPLSQHTHHAHFQSQQATHSDKYGLWMEGVFWLTFGAVLVYVFPKFIQKRTF